MAKETFLSIIITSYTLERLEDIYELIDSINNQSYSNIETIIVIERSRELFEKVKKYHSHNPRISLNTIFNRDQHGLSASRNLGIKEAKGEVIAFVDDDVVLFPNWAEEMVKAYENDNIIGITGPAMPLWEDPSMSWFPEEFSWIMSCTSWNDNNEIREVRNAWGMNMSFRREVFDSGDLFFPDFGLRNSQRLSWIDPPSEDVDLSLRVKRRTGKRIIYVPSVKVKHRVSRQRLTWKFIVQRSVSVGYQRRMLKRLYLNDNSCEKLLEQEQALIKRIFSKLLPDIGKGIFIHPIKSYRKLSVTTVILTCVGIGYCFSFTK